MIDVEIHQSFEGIVLTHVPPGEQFHPVWIGAGVDQAVMGVVLHAHRAELLGQLGDAETAFSVIDGSAGDGTLVDVPLIKRLFET